MTAAVERFRELLRIPTVSYATDGDVDGQPFADFARAIERLYPLLHEHLERETVAGHSLLYRWRGARPEDPLVLMAHMDVVPVVAEEWQHPPFAATIAGDGPEAEIHARGAIDDKGALVAILEAVEDALAAGETPPRDVYLSFGHNEETAGDGARRIVERLRERGVRPGLVLDEGGAVVTGVLPGVVAPTAMIGVAERGVATITLTVKEAGGHASTPPAMPATARLARAIDRLRRRPFPRRLSPPVRAMLATVAAAAPPMLAAVYRRADLLAPVLTGALSAAGSETNALVRTTAVVTELSGATGENVLATRAIAAVNVRILPGESVASALAHIRRVVRDPLVEVAVRSGSDPSPVSPWKGAAWGRVAAAVRETLGDDVVPVPYLQLGASDSRWFTALSDNVYRFAPFRLTRAERDALHAADERIRIDVWLRGIGFYRALINAP